MCDQTDHSLPVVLKHLSPTWVRALDEKAGQLQQENGMNFKLEAQFEGCGRPKWYDVIARYLPWKQPKNQ